MCQEVYKTGIHVDGRMTLYALAKISDRFLSNFRKFFNMRLFEASTPLNERGDRELSFGYTLAKNGSTLKKLWVFEVGDGENLRMSQCVSKCIRLIFM